MMFDWTTILTFCAIISVGMMSGLYWAFTIAVMPGLAESDDRTFIAVMQAINRRIQNIWFLPVFLGSVVLPVATAVTLFVSNDSEATAWGVAGGLLAILPVVITGRGNIPLNTALASAGDGGDLDDPAAVRRSFERPWNRLNLWRTVCSTLAFVALIGAVVQQ